MELICPALRNVLGKTPAMDEGLRLVGMASSPSPISPKKSRTPGTASLPAQVQLEAFRRGKMRAALLSSKLFASYEQIWAPLPSGSFLVSTKKITSARRAWATKLVV